jgi:hypothetical protein
VAVEAAVLDRDECRTRHRFELRGLNGRFLDRAAPRDRLALVRYEQKRRILERLERARQRRGDDQPQQGDQKQPGDRVEDQSKAAPVEPDLPQDAEPKPRRRRMLQHNRIGQLFDIDAAAAPDAVPFRHAGPSRRSRCCFSRVIQLA